MSRLIWIALIGFIVYQVSFTWIPLWKKATELKGMNVSDIQIEDENGQKVSVSQFKGEILIVNFWASWCVPCRLEIPLLNGIYSSLAVKDKRLIGVNSGESQQTIDTFREKISISFPVYRDAGELARRLNVRVIPAIAVIDGEGKIVSITYGFRPWVQAYLLWWI